jgi:hypothetical protein
MRDFAKASKLLLQPLPGPPEQYLDPTFPHIGTGQVYQDFNIEEHMVTEPTDSRYGDTARWNLL